MTYPKLAAVCAVIAALTLTCATRTNGKNKPENPPEQPATAGKLPPLNPNEVYKPNASRESNGQSKNKPVREKEVRVTIDPSIAMLGEVVRSVGKQGGNVVLMNGVESRVVDRLQIKKRPLRDAVAMLVAAGGLAVEENPQYYFLFPDGYNQLLGVSLVGRLDPRFAEVRADVTFGYGLPLYAVFMWMGYALRTTIVADDSVGDARCGELSLRQVPLDITLAAILKSARVAAVAADSSPDYIFLAAPANANTASALLEESSLDDKRNAILAKRVRLALPRPLRTGERMELAMNASRLGDVLPALTEQLGVRVVAEKGLEKFPINPVYFHDVTVRTAMDLLIRQWLEPNYGYQVLDDRIVIRRK